MLLRKSKIPFKQMILFGLLPGFLKKALYRIKGYKIGKNVSIGIGSIISGKDVSIGDNTKIGNLSIIRGKKILIGRFVQIGTLSIIDTERIEIDDDARINEQVIIGGLKTPDSFIKLGKRTIVMEYSFLNPTKPLIIGDDSGVGGHCLLFTHGSWLSQLEGYPVSFEPITIGKNVWLPWRVFILPGTTIGDNVVIGANSLVSKNIPSNVLIAGSPAKIIKENFPEKPDPAQKEEILNNILNDFQAYIKYSGLQVSTSTNDINQEILISKKSKKNYIYVLNKGPINIKNTNSIIVQKYEDELQNISLPEKVMIINLQTKQRIGSSDVGEELVKFISRYGLRFDRID